MLQPSTAVETAKSGVSGRGLPRLLPLANLLRGARADAGPGGGSVELFVYAAWRMGRGEGN